MRAQCLVGVVQQVDVLDVEEAALLDQPCLAQQLLHVVGARFGEGDRAGLLVLLVILLDELRDQLVRSEEHTSELQSLMRISYAVFCLKKKNKQQQQIENT